MRETMTIKLYTLCGADPKKPFSPHSWKAVMALSHKGLDFTEMPMAFTAIPQIEGGVSKTVPVIADGNLIVVDSFLIAIYLEETYPDRPSLFGGPGGQAAARLIENWTNINIHAALRPIVLRDIHDCLGPEDQAYFRRSRESRMGMTLEQATATRQRNIEEFPAHLATLRMMLKFQPFIGGTKPLFGDHIVFGALQWARIVTRANLFADNDPVEEWFERCLDLYGGVGRAIPAAA